MKRNTAITTLVALAVAGCGGSSEEAEVEEEPVEKGVEEISEPPCIGSDCRGRLPLLLATPAEFDRDDIEGQKCKLSDSLWQLTDDPDDPPICASRDEAIWAVEHGESGPRAGRAVSEPVETVSPATVEDTTTTSTTATTLPVFMTRKAEASLKDTKWWVLSEAHHTLTQPLQTGIWFTDNGPSDDGSYEMTRDAIDCFGDGSWCAWWQQDGRDVEIWAWKRVSDESAVRQFHAQVKVRYSGTVHQSGDIITGMANWWTSPIDEGWEWGAVWCAPLAGAEEGHDRPMSNYASAECYNGAEERLSEFIDLNWDD